MRLTIISVARVSRKAPFWGWPVEVVIWLTLTFQNCVGPDPLIGAAEEEEGWAGIGSLSEASIP